MEIIARLFGQGAVRRHRFPALHRTLKSRIMASMMNMPLPSTTFLLVRHGETDANVTSIWQGSSDSPLNERGRLQSQMVAERLAADGYAGNVVYASPLSRASETAEAIARRVNAGAVHLEPDLAEFHLGEWEGLSYDELRLDRRLWDRMAEDPNFAPPGGESAAQFAVRLVRVFQDIAGRHPGETVIVVSHGGAIATAIAMLVDRDGSRWTQYLMANCALSEMAWNPAPVLVRMNDTAHLDAGARPRNWGAE